MLPTSRLSIASDPRPWPLLGSFDPTTTALVVIDMQVDFVRPDGWFAALGFDLSAIRAIVPTLAQLLAAAREVPGLSVVHTRQGNAPDLSDLPEVKREQARRKGVPYGHPGPHGRGLIRGEPGWDFLPELAPDEGERVVDKTGFGAFAGTDLDPWLRDRGVRALILTGVTANVCVLSTLYGAVDLGYDCLVLADAVAGATPASVATVIDLVHYQGGLFGAVARAGDVAGLFRRFAAG